MGKLTKFILLYLVLTLLAASAHAREKKACKALNGRCLKKGEDCDGQTVKAKGFCKGKSYSCCFPVEQKQCPTVTPAPAMTTREHSVKPPPVPTGPMPTESDYVRPVIGILAQDMTSGMKKILPQYNQYIAASYVKWIESGGAKVVPILTDKDDDYYDTMVKRLNGFVFPGGGASITDSTSYGKTGRRLYDRIVKAGEDNPDNPVPLWGTCLGFQMINYIECNPRTRKKVLSACEGTDYINLPLNLTEHWASSELFGSAPDSIMGPIANWDITHNIHDWGVTPETFEECEIGNNYTVLSTNHDKKGMEFISTIEHKRLPIWGAQWHIEKNAYEWYSWQKVPKFSEAIHQEHHFARFFVDQARKNTNKFPWQSQLREVVIYNTAPVNMDDYRYPTNGDEPYKGSWIQAYFFE